MIRMFMPWTPPRFPARTINGLIVLAWKEVGKGRAGEGEGEGEKGRRGDDCSVIVG
jgi:hypothetical protein